MSVASHYFFPSFWQLSDTILKKRCIFSGDPQIDLFFDFFIKAEIVMSQTVCQRSKQMLVGTRRKKIVVLSNQIVDIELTKLFFFLNEFSVFPTNLFVESTKEFVIAFCLTKIFVRRTKILLRRQKKVCRFYIFLRKGVTSGEYRE